MSKAYPDYVYWGGIAGMYAIAHGLAYPFGIRTSVNIAFGMQAIAGIPSAMYQNEHYYDFTGSLTYLALIITAVLSNLFAGSFDLRKQLSALFVIVWAIRLGSFLLMRVKRVGKDVRFDKIKTNMPFFLAVWAMQGLWVFLTAYAVLILHSWRDESPQPLGELDFLGVALWIGGFVAEVLADQQKTQFNTDPKNKGKFINVGLWSMSRHPNYAGEITLWVGQFLLSLGSQHVLGWAGVLSPIFVYLLISRVSGVPMLERTGKKKWGETAEYKAYVKNVPVLFPNPFGGSTGASATNQDSAKATKAE
eukprot:GFYU01004241.1.p1 GENE.GFYU01004241.1~~GFYU01004241.1.p1  ORF type:complete len:334 (+),score=70.33 GFYU01004241.1:86-1003(+)